MDLPLMHLSSAFGLSASAGLNAYVPLLLLSVMANRGWIHLHAPYDVVGAWWCVALLAVLCAVELVVDKVPGADHVNDVVQTMVRPTAGAVVFGMEMGTVTSVHPGVWVVLGLLTAGAVHATKAVARPPLNVATVGLAAPVVSTVENVGTVALSVISVVAPVLVIFVMMGMGYVGYRVVRRFLRRREVGVKDGGGGLAVAGR